MVGRKIILLLIFLGILDTAYLMWEHYTGYIPACPAHSLLGSYIDCGRVLGSSYAAIYGVPLAVIGFGYYLFLLAITLLKPKLLLLITPAGLLFSLCLLYVQIFILHAICLYCTFSGLLNLLIFLLIWSSKLSLMWKPKNSTATTMS